MKLEDLRVMSPEGKWLHRPATFDDIKEVLVGMGAEEEWRCEGLTAIPCSPREKVHAEAYRCGRYLVVPF
jgi:hypothetical protein